MGRETSALPHELFDMCIELALEEARVTRDGLALRKIMHVSIASRLKVVQAFDALKLYEWEGSFFGRSPCLIPLPRTLMEGTWQLIHHHLLLDFAARRKVHMAPLDEQEGALEPIITFNGERATSVRARLTVLGNELERDVLASGIAEQEFERQVGGTEEDAAPATVCTALMALEGVAAAMAAVPYYFNPYQRAFFCAFEVPKEGVDLELEMYFRVERNQIPDTDEGCRRAWKFCCMGPREFE